MKLGKLSDWHLVGDGLAFGLLGSASRRVRFDLAVTEPAMISVGQIDEGAFLEEICLGAHQIQSYEFTIDHPVQIRCSDPRARVRTYEAEGLAPESEEPAFTRLHERKTQHAFEAMLNVATKNAELRADNLEREVRRLSAVLQSKAG